MRSWHSGIAAGLAALTGGLLFLTECKSSSEGCAPGLSIACTCTNGASGAQVCGGATHTFGPCDCSGNGSGSGSGGNTGSGSGAGTSSGTSSGTIGSNGCPSGMAFVAGGSYVFSETNATTTVSDFCLDTTEITVAAYQACVQSGSCSAANTQEYWPGGISRADACNTGAPGTDDNPINCVSYTQAVAYCSSHRRQNAHRGRVGVGRAERSVRDELPVGQ